MGEGWDTLVAVFAPVCPMIEVEGIESSVYSTPPDDQGGALAVSVGRGWQGPLKYQYFIP